MFVLPCNSVGRARLCGPKGYNYSPRRLNAISRWLTANTRGVAPLTTFACLLASLQSSRVNAHERLGEDLERGAKMESSAWRTHRIYRLTETWAMNATGWRRKVLHIRNAKVLCIVRTSSGEQGFYWTAQYCARHGANNSLEILQTQKDSWFQHVIRIIIIRID